MSLEIYGAHISWCCKRMCQNLARDAGALRFQSTWDAEFTFCHLGSGLSGDRVRRREDEPQEDVQVVAIFILGLVEAWLKTWALYSHLPVLRFLLKHLLAICFCTITSLIFSVSICNMEAYLGHNPNSSLRLARCCWSQPHITPATAILPLWLCSHALQYSSGFLSQGLWPCCCLSMEHLPWGLLLFLHEPLSMPPSHSRSQS